MQKQAIYEADIKTGRIIKRQTLVASAKGVRRETVRRIHSSFPRKGK